MVSSLAPTFAFLRRDWWHHRVRTWGDGIANAKQSCAAPRQRDTLRVWPAADGVTHPDVLIEAERNAMGLAVASTTLIPTLAPVRSTLPSEHRYRRRTARVSAPRFEPFVHGVHDGAGVRDRLAEHGPPAIIPDAADRATLQLRG